MRKLFISMLALAVVATPAVAGGPVRVNGYVTKNGTYVAPHYRSSPDSSKLNNWSTQGNYNPYTGKQGTQNPYGSSTYRSPYSTPSNSYQPSNSGSYYGSSDSDDD